jgi:murein L,D-transpeptidase YafK
MWRALVVLLIVAVAGVGYYFMTPEGRQQIDRARINLKRAEYRALFRAGETLPGAPNFDRFEERLAALGVKRGVPVYIRIFKLESELELWVEKDGRFERFATYPICLWSGRLGPKLKEGDRQAPEGFYTVDAEQLNPNSVEHRSFSLGFPNVFDRAHGRTGSHLMVHGGCASIGCFAMTHAAVDEIWRMVTAALEAGQARFPVHVFPFRMTESALNFRKGYRWHRFWSDLKKGYDLFKPSRIPPAVSVCNGRYAFEPGTIETANDLIEERCPPRMADKPG